MHLPHKNTYNTAISSVDLLFLLFSFMQTCLVFHFENWNYVYFRMCLKPQYDNVENTQKKKKNKHQKTPLKGRIEKISEIFNI